MLGRRLLLKAFCVVERLMCQGIFLEKYVGWRRGRPAKLLTYRRRHEAVQSDFIPLWEYFHCPLRWIQEPFRWIISVASKSLWIYCSAVMVLKFWPQHRAIKKEVEQRGAMNQQDNALPDSIAATTVQPWYRLSKPVAYNSVVHGQHKSTCVLPLIRAVRFTLSPKITYSFDNMPWLLRRCSLLPAVQQKTIKIYI